MLRSAETLLNDAGPSYSMSQVKKVNKDNISSADKAQIKENTSTWAKPC